MWRPFLQCAFAPHVVWCGVVHSIEQDPVIDNFNDESGSTSDLIAALKKIENAGHVRVRGLSEVDGESAAKLFHGSAAAASGKVPLVPQFPPALFSTGRTIP
jgi:hypothetical protein